MTVEIAIALVWKDGRLLVTRRRAGTHLGGLWEFPGGKILPCESVERCAEREVEEETGVRCRAERVRPTLRHAYPERTVVLHPVDCAWLAGEPRAREVEAALWLLHRELAQYAFPEANSALLDDLARA